MCPMRLLPRDPFGRAFAEPVLTAFREVRTPMAPIVICRQEVTIQEMPCQEGKAVVISIASEMSGNKDRLMAGPVQTVS